MSVSAADQDAEGDLRGDSESGDRRDDDCRDRAPAELGDHVPAIDEPVARDQRERVRGQRRAAATPRHAKPSPAQKHEHEPRRRAAPRTEDQILNATTHSTHGAGVYCWGGSESDRGLVPLPGGSSHTIDTDWPG